MSRYVLNCGYVPLADCAPLIVAQELGFAADEGLELNLLRQPSWAALRDLLALGHLDAAHMLVPLPIAMSVGLSGKRVQTDILMLLSAGGIFVGVAAALADAMRVQGWTGDLDDPRGARAALEGAAGGRHLRVGVPFPYAMHHLLFRYLARGTSLDFEAVTTPPPLMARGVADGELDVFVVGEPWGSVVVEGGWGELILPGAAIWQAAPEKALAARRDWAEADPGRTGALMRAVYRAADWLDTPSNRALAIEILARTEHLDLSHQALDPSLTGRIVTRRGTAPVEIDRFLRFHRGATTFPWRSQAAWIGAQIADLHGRDSRALALEAKAVMRPDLYRAYIAQLGADLPGASAKLEGAMAYRTAVASTRGNMILGPDAFFDGIVYESPPA
ncbi:MAG: CmpA/NrtA family ABC transporter substrate-binding protein [Pseudomonadota bacterium]